jgi:hypothetical protein
VQPAARPYDNVRLLGEGIKLTPGFSFGPVLKIDVRPEGVDRPAVRKLAVRGLASLRDAEVEILFLMACTERPDSFVILGVKEFSMLARQCPKLDIALITEQHLTEELRERDLLRISAALSRHVSFLSPVPVQ